MLKPSVELHSDNIKRVFYFFLLVTVIMAVGIHFDLKSEQKELIHFLEGETVSKDLQTHFGRGYEVVGMKDVHAPTMSFDLHVKQVGEDFIVRYRNREIEKIDYHYNCISFIQKDVKKKKCFVTTVYQKK